nr:uncharacterized protein LOC113690125 [Coffea arabica]
MATGAVPASFTGLKSRENGLGFAKSMEFVRVSNTQRVKFRRTKVSVIKNSNPGQEIVELQPASEGSPLLDATTDLPSDSASKLPVLQMGTSLAVSFAICKASTSLTRFFGIQNCDLPVITTIVVILATSFPGYFRPIAPTADAIAVALMQVFFAVVGAGGSIWNVINTAPSIFMLHLFK